MTKKQEGVKLSFTRIDSYLRCPKSFEFRYIHNLRERTVSSALIFGKAMDAALNELLLKKDLEGAIELFKKELSQIDHNGRIVYTETSDEVVYLTTDKDSSFVPEEIENPTNYDCILYRGLAILKAYNRDILPRISEVSHVQEKIELSNDCGDVIEGYIDFVAKIDGKGPYVLDHKTSGSKYSDDSVARSMQLPLYAFDVGLRQAGYIVMLKKPKKDKETKEILPEFQIILDETHENQVNFTLETARQVADLIKAKEFPKNESACKNFFGKQCPYYNICQGWDSTDKDLEYVDPKNRQRK